MMKRVISVVFLLVLMMLLPVTVLADASVTYEGGAEAFVTVPEGDLFESFKGVMPGDTVKQTVTVKNDLSGNYNVKIYLRAIAHDESNPLSTETAKTETAASMTDFLSKLSMTVCQGDQVLFEATADQLGGLKENVLLGTFSRGQSTELTVQLTVPVELGNEYTSRVGEVDWVSTAEEIAVDPVGPVTGDNANVMLLVILLVISAAALIALLYGRRKVQKNS